MNIEGKLHVKKDTEQVSDSFKKREFVVEYAENILYPQFIKFELIQDRCELIDSYQVGAQIEVQFNLKGREWTNPEGEKKYFTTLDAWRIQPVEVKGQVKGSEASVAAVNSMEDISGDGNEDLPF